MKLKSIRIKGYKSIDIAHGASLDLGDVTLLLGANGVGKSNLVSFFSLLNEMMTGNLQNYIAERGYADAFLYFGSKQTRQMQAAIAFSDGTNTYTYQFTLTHAVSDILIFSEETLTFHRIGKSKPTVILLNQGVRETDLLQYVIRKDLKPAQRQIATTLLKLLRDCNVFHFHDTSNTAKIRGQGYIEDNHYLNSDAGNLAAFLYRLKENEETHPYYQKMVRYVQKAMPQFGDFELRPNDRNKNYISLNWRDKNNSQHLFGSHQISDGSLRFMALATLLLQPVDLQPNVIVLDEPELGLHPSAIAYLSGMIKAASKKAQIIIATQSQRLIDEFEVENILIVERDRSTNSTSFQSKNAQDLSNWLEEYSLSELWEKNVIGGQP
jgi:predicted ATPase